MDEQELMNLIQTGKITFAQLITVAQESGANYFTAGIYTKDDEPLAIVVVAAGTGSSEKLLAALETCEAEPQKTFERLVDPSVN